MSGVTGNLKNHQERIVRDKGICGGEPVFKGTRVTLRTVLASLAGGRVGHRPSLKTNRVPHTPLLRVRVLTFVALPTAPVSSKLFWLVGGRPARLS